MRLLRIALVVIGAGIVIIYLIFAIFLYLSQAKLVYYPDFPDRKIAATPEQIGLNYERVEFYSSDCVKLTGWFIPARKSRGVVLFCHGNAGNISHRLESIKLFHDLGLSILIFDYRGYGESEGNPSEEGTYSDVQAAWEYLINVKRIFPDKIVVFGRSLGGAIATWLAHNNTPKALILESTFTSIPDLAAELYPCFPVRLLCRFQYNTEEYLKEVKCPVLIIHSEDDELVTIKHGEILFDAANEPKEFLRISGKHDDGFLNSIDMYKEGLDDFIRRFVKE